MVAQYHAQYHTQEGWTEMPAVIAVPELMAEAATDLATVGDTLNAAHMAAAAPTVAVLPAAADEVSASIAHLFSGYAEDYQKLAGQAAASYEQFVQHLTASASAYASAEAANVAELLQPLTAASASTASAAAALDPSVVSSYLNQVMGRLGIVINALPGSWNLLPQQFFVDPWGPFSGYLSIR